MSVEVFTARPTSGGSATRPTPATVWATEATCQPHVLEHARILIVDDESLNIDVVQGYLECDGFLQVDSTANAVRAVPMVREFRPDLVLLDINMPEVSGIDILKTVRADGDTDVAMTPVVILTANTADEVKIEALECGATDLLAKPVNRGELLARIRNVLSAKAYRDALDRHRESLEDAVRERTADLEASRLEVIHCLARAAEFRDDDTGEHIFRVGRYARMIGEQLGLSRAHLELLEPAAQLHDVGKIGIPDAILLKPGKLTAEEFELMQKHCGYGKKIVDSPIDSEVAIIRNHTELGAKIMGTARSPVLEMAKRIAMTHHERWDGGGYPLGLSGEDIPLEGRITAVADVFDALSSKRAYKPAFPLSKCFHILEEGRAAHFDPAVLDAFFARRNEIIRVQIEMADTH